MKISQFVESTTAGSIASVPVAQGKTQTRNQGIYPDAKGGTMFKGKKTSKPFANSIAEDSKPNPYSNSLIWDPEERSRIHDLKALMGTFGTSAQSLRQARMLHNKGMLKATPKEVALLLRLTDSSGTIKPRTSEQGVTEEYTPYGPGPGDGRGGRSTTDPLRRHPANSSYMDKDYMIKFHQDQLKSIAASPYTRLKDVARHQKALKKLGVPEQGVAEARGMASVNPYVELMQSLGWFMSMNTAKIAQDAIDSAAQQELKTMQQQFNKPIINGKKFADVVSDPTMFKHPKVAPALLKFAYDILGYIEPRIKKYIRPELQSKWMGSLSKLKDQYRAAVQFTSGQQGVAEGSMNPHELGYDHGNRYDSKNRNPFPKGSTQHQAYEQGHEEGKSDWWEQDQQSVAEDSDPCWKNYKKVGMKDKNGKQVPNCVPKEGVSEAEIRENDIVLTPGKGSKLKPGLHGKDRKSSPLSKFRPPFKASGLWVSDSRGTSVLECVSQDLAPHVAAALNMHVKMDESQARLKETGATPLRDKADYFAKRSALQRIQMDPKLRSNSPANKQMIAALVKRKIELDNAARAAGYVDESMNEQQLDETTANIPTSSILGGIRSSHVIR